MISHRRIGRIGSSMAACALLLLASAAAMAVPLAQGPMLSATTPNSANIWARFSAQATASWEVRAVGQSQFRSGGNVAANAANDFTSSFVIEALLPDTSYEYRMVSVGSTGVREVSASSYFRTPKTNPANFTFHVLADFALKLKPSNAVRAAGSPRPDFVAVIGDWDHRDPASPPGTSQPYPPDEADTVLENMRQMHRDTRSPANPIGSDIYQSFIRSTSPSEPQVPLYYAWDDHDFCMNNAGADCLFTPAAFQSYAEYFKPSADNGLVDTSGCGGRGDWQSFRYGTIATFFLLDARSNRVDGSTMLGECQLAWLQNGLRSATTTWKFVLTPVTFNPGTKPWDGWAGFIAERNRLLNFIRTSHIKRVVVISGDIHSGGAIDDGTNSGLPEVSVPHANMPRTWVNTYCRVDKQGQDTLHSTPGTWTLGGLQDPNTQIRPPSCLGKDYSSMPVAALPPPPYPLDGTDSPGYLRAQISQKNISLQILDANGNLKSGFRADGSSAPMRLDLTNK